MTRTLQVDGSSITSLIRRDSMQFAEAANRGEVGVGGMTYDDPASAGNIPALKLTTLSDNAMASGNQRIFTGYTGVRRPGRGDSQRAGSDRQWDIDIVEQNARLSEQVIYGPDGIRDEETDVARVQAFLTSAYLNVWLYDLGMVEGANTVTMEAEDYRGRYLQDVLDDCAEQSGKNFFVYTDSQGAVVAGLYYGLSTNALFTSPVRISNVNSDVERATGVNLITNPGFEVNNAGWSVAGAGGISAAATSILRITSDSFNLTAGSGELITTATNGSGTFYAITGTFLAGVTYRLSVALKWVSGTKLAKVTFGSLGTPADRASITPTLYSFGGSGAWLVYTIDWTPTLNRSDAQLAVMNNTAAVMTARIDFAEAFEPKTFAPISPQRTQDPSNIFSTVEVTFRRGTVRLNNPTTETNYKVKETTLTVPSRTTDGATIRGNQFLAAAASEMDSITCDLQVADSEVNLVRAGQRILVKLVGHGLPNWTFYRVTNRTITTMSPTVYRLGLQLMLEVKATRFVGIGNPRPDLEDEQIPNGGFEWGVTETDNRINDWVVLTGTARTYDAPNPPTTARPRPKGGQRALRVLRTTASTVRTEDFAPVAAKVRYLYRGWALWNAGGKPSAPTITILWYDHKYTLVKTELALPWVLGLTGVWTRLQKIYTAPATAAYRKILLTNPSGAAGEFTYFDVFTFKETDLTTAPTT